MFVYITIFVVLVMLGVNLSDRQARKFLPWVSIFFVWFIGARYYVGCDFGSYVNRYQNILGSDGLWNALFQDEGGFQVLMTAVKKADLGFVWVNVIAAIIFMTCVVIFCLNNRRPLMILALLFPVIIIQLGMSGVRQALAAAFVMAATVAFVRKRRAVTGLLIFMGSLFHLSAIIFLPIALLPGRVISIKKLLFSIVILSPISYLLLASRADVYIDRYVDDVYGEMTSGGALIRYVLVFVPAVFFVRYRAHIKNQFPKIFDLLFLFSVIIFSIFPLVFISTVVLHRVIYYVMPVGILMFIYVSLVVSPRRNVSVKRLAPALIFGTYSLFWFLTSRHATLCYVPYQNYLMQ